MTFLKRFSAVTTVTFSILVLIFPLSTSSAKGKPEKEDDSGSQVTVCHFNGHNGDFVTFNNIDHPNGQPQCDAQGGNALVIGENACGKGHGAEESFFACSEGHLQSDGTEEESDDGYTTYPDSDDECDSELDENCEPPAA